MAWHHHHDHGHHHHAGSETGPLDPSQFDSANRSLAEALRISFIILKVIMAGIVLAFVATCLQTIGPQEQGILLRFGQIQTCSDGEVALKPGLRFVWPYPIEELVKIPVSTKTSLAINSFWYFQTAEEILNDKTKSPIRPPDKLDPLMEGYCLTRGEDLGSLVDISRAEVRQGVLRGGDDYGIAHSRWQVTYEISDIRAFFKNVPVEIPRPGENYYELMKKGVGPILQACTEEAVVKTMARYSIDELIASKDSIPSQVRDLVQGRLSSMDSGVRVVSVTLTNFTWPRQVDDAFNAFITASQQARTQVSQAQGTAQSTLNEAAGAVAADLAAALERPSVDPNRLESLWSQVAGECQTQLAEARAYRTAVVESAKSGAEYFQRLLPEYRNRPKLVVQNLYLDAMGEVLASADEKLLLEPKASGQQREVRVLLNRDPAIRAKQAKEPGQQQK